MAYGPTGERRKNGGVGPLQVELFKELCLTDAEFRLSLTKALVSDPDCVIYFKTAAKASIYEDLGKTLFSKFLLAVGTIVSAFLAGIATGHVSFH